MKHNPFSVFSKRVDRARKTSDAFLNSLETRYQKRTIFTAVLIFLICFTLLASLTANALTNGDAALYAEQIERLDFSHITTHLAYFVFGAMFTRLLPGSDDFALNLMNCFFGALSISLIYLIGFTMFRKHSIASVSSLFLLLNYVFVVNALYAEVYIMQTFFFLAALLCWLLNKPIATGVSFALSFLVTPSTILALPCLIVLRPHRQALFRFGATLFMIAGIALLPRIDNYLFGNRGLMGAANHPINIRNAVIKEGYEAIYGLFLTIPFIVMGVKGVISQVRLRPFGLAILCLWIVNFLFGERFTDVPVQLPLYALLGVIAGLGYQTISTNPVSNGNSNKRLIVVWSSSVISLVILAALALAIKVGKTPVQMPSSIPTAFGIIVVLYAMVFTILTKVLNTDRINNSLIALSLMIMFGCMNGAMLLTVVKKINRNAVEYRDAVLEMKDAASLDYRVIGGWNKGMLFEHYVFRKHGTGYWMNTECLLGYWGKKQQDEFVKEWRTSLATGRELWLLEYYPNLVSELQNAGYTVKASRNIYHAMPQK